MMSGENVNINFDDYDLTKLKDTNKELKEQLESWKEKINQIEKYLITKGDATKNESTREKTLKNKGSRENFIQELLKIYYKIQKALSKLPLVKDETDDDMRKLKKLILSIQFLEPYLSKFQLDLTTNNNDYIIDIVDLQPVIEQLQKDRDSIIKSKLKNTLTNLEAEKDEKKNPRLKLGKLTKFIEYINYIKSDSIESSAGTSQNYNNNYISVSPNPSLGSKKRKKYKKKKKNKGTVKGRNNEKKKTTKIKRSRR